MVTFILIMATSGFLYWYSERRYMQGYEDGYNAVRQHNPHGIPPVNGGLDSE